MLTSNTFHEWSRAGTAWFTPQYYTEDSALHLGGSREGWLSSSGGNGDKRPYLSFWGYNGYNPEYSGGCCAGQESDTATTWQQPFAMSYAVAPDVDFFTFLFVEVDVSTDANSAFWELHCTGIPAGAVHLKLQTGSVTDYFKPKDGGGKSFCSMFAGDNKHMSSPDGKTWNLIDKGLPYSDWGQPFTFSYAIEAPSKPAQAVNVNAALNVLGSTITGSSTWGNLCKDIPEDTLHMVVTMGDVKDHFK